MRIQSSPRTLLRRALPPDLKARLKGTRLHSVYTRGRANLEHLLMVGETRLLDMVGRSGVTSSAYYALASRRFDREHWAVVEGRIAYLRNITGGASSSPLLRRNVHRLEKGLLMRPRRRLFALEFAAETVEIYEKVLLAAQANGGPTNEVHWAHDVLRSYFEACQGAAELESARQRFESLPPPRSSCVDAFAFRSERTPYQREVPAAPAVKYEDLLRLAQHRRSVRWFSARQVERDLIDKALEVGRLAPSACNRMPYEFRVLDEPALARKAAELAAGTTGYAHQVPVTVVVLGDLSAYFHERDRHLIYIDSSLAIMGFILALESLGLSSCCINWSDIPAREEAMAKFLGDVPVYKRPIMLIAVGYPDETGAVAYSSKKEIDALRRFNFEGRDH